MNNYIPFLKLKSNEILAVGELEEPIVPFFDFPKKDGLDEDGFKTSTETMRKKIEKYLGENFSFYLDNFDIDSIFTVDGSCSYQHLIDSFSSYQFIPVLSIDRTPDHIASIYDSKSSGKISSDVVALRLCHEDFESFDVSKDDIHDLLFDALSLFEAVDVIFDNRVCIGVDVGKTAWQMFNFINAFSTAYSVRRVVSTGSSIPPSFAQVAGVGTESTVERKELEIHAALLHLTGESFDLFLGDYGIVSPDYSDVTIPAEVMQNVLTPKIVYSYGTVHYATRGYAIKTNPRGLAQFNDLAARLISYPFYRGASYSFGDNFINEKAAGKGNNVTPSSILKPTINAHVAYMLKDYS